MDDVWNLGVTPVLLQKWPIVLGFFLPLVLAVVNQRGWSRQRQAAVAALVVLVATFIKVLIERGDFNFTRWWVSAWTVFVGSVAAYHGLWKPLKITQWLEAKTGGDSMQEQDIRERPNHVH